MIPNLEFDDEALVGAPILFGNEKRRWEVQSTLTLSRDVNNSPPNQIPFRVFAVPTHSPGSECPCRIVNCRTDLLSYTLTDDEILLYLDEKHSIVVVILLPECPQLSFEC
ncbi:MAG: hypothetical protein RL536_66 [Candidatus Parcubacteria bacterium]